MSAATPVPFETNNQALAIALDLNGFRILDIQNRWTPEMLKARGLKSIEEAATLKKDGNVHFIIERKPGIQAAIDAYNEELPTSGGEEIELSIRDGMRAAKAVLVNRGEIAKWRMRPATWKLVEMDGKVTFEDLGGGEKRLNVPAMRVTPAFFKEPKHD